MEEMHTSPSSSCDASGLSESARAALGGLAIGRLGIVHPQRDLMHAVAVQMDVFGDRIVGPQRRGQHEADLVLLQNVRSAISQLPVSGPL